MRTRKIYCPVNGWDCPYFKNDECALENPYNDCEDFAIFFEEDEDPTCDEPRTAFE